jgi:hypothetical protein
MVDLTDTSMAASGTTKKVTVNQILGAGGTATLASATITGNLTVDTNTLFVDAANNRVGIINASPTYPLDVVGTGRFVQANFTDNILRISTGGSTTGNLNQILFADQATTATSAITAYNSAFGSGKNYALGFTTNGSERYLIDSTGISTWSVGGTTAMTLNSTGLGIGRTPANKLDIGGTGTQVVRIQTTTSGDPTLTLEAAGADGCSILYDRTNGGMRFDISAITGAMRLSTTGNVGVGVTPSAWSSGYKVLDIAGGGGITSLSNGLYLASNGYDNSGWKKKGAGYANLLLNVSGEYRFNTSTAGGGVAGDAITFTQAMTLDASGNLLLATTTNTPSARQYINQASGSNPALYIAGGASTTPLINFNGAGRIRSDGQYLVMETTNASGVVYITANTNGVYLSVGGTSWTANSDERLKDIIEPISNAVAKVGSLRSVIGKFKTDSEGTRRTFLIAQDVQKVLPEAVDASNPDRLGVGYSEVIPLLVAAIKELTARVQTLEAK